MDFSHLSIDERLPRYELIMNVIETDTVVRPILANFGFDDTVIAEGRTLFTNAFNLYQEKIREYGEQFGATDVFNAARDQAYENYMNDVGIARVALKDDRNLLSQLELMGDREHAYDKLYMQMTMFYDTALADTDIQTKLGRFNITVDKLTAGKALVTDMNTKYMTQRKEMSEAQGATQARDEAVDLLDKWIADFVGVATIALGAYPQVLERLGLVDPS